MIRIQLRTFFLRAFRLTLTSLAAVSMAIPAHAASTDSMLEGAKLCTKQFPEYERRFGIPKHLLAAVAVTETGRYHKRLKVSVPWPWAVNAEGKGHFFDTKREAVAFVKRLKRAGVKSMDVGCMQVNLYHHAEAFNSIEEAFEPTHNVAYAAHFLRSLYDESNSWKTASAYYHSRTPSLGNKYAGKVYSFWRTILSRINAGDIDRAIANAPDYKIVRPDSPYVPSKPKSNVKITVADTALSGNTKNRLIIGEAVKRQMPRYTSPTVKIISVRDEAAPTAGNAVVLSTDNKQPRRQAGPVIKVAEVSASTGSMPRITRGFDSLAPSAGVSQKAEEKASGTETNKKTTGPRFIFVD